MPRPLIPSRSVLQTGLGREEEQFDTRQEITDVVVAVVTSVYPIDHPLNPSGQMLVDVICHQELGHFRFVPVATVYAHQETEIARPLSTRRQPYEPKARQRIEGTSYDLRAGTRVLLGFVGRNQRQPMILAALPMNLQGALGHPAELVAVDTFGDDHKLTKQQTWHPLQATRAEYPRAVDGMNGTRRWIDNRGNFYIQTTNDRESVFPGHNGIPAAPAPQGNVGISTRGAVMGSQGRITGRDPSTGDTNEVGNIRDETLGAEVGNAIRRLASDVGRIWESTRGSGDGRVYIEDKERSYVSLRADGDAEMHGDSVTLDGDTINLGNDSPSYQAVLYEPLEQFIDTITTIFDSHTHSGVQSGDDDTDAPNAGQHSLHLMMKDLWKSDNVKLVKSESASPTYEADPDEES